jgi:hypothetical protein
MTSGIVVAVTPTIVAGLRLAMLVARLRLVANIARLRLPRGNALS